MSANGGADKNLRVTTVRQVGWWRLLIKSSGLWESVSLSDLGLGESSDEDGLTIPRSLEHFTWWQLRDIKLLVRVSDISSSSVHLTVDDHEDGLKTKDISGKDETLEHIDLGTLNLVVLVLLIPQSVLIEPVVSLGLGIEWITEVGRSRAGDPVGWPVGAKLSINELLRLSLVVLLQNTEVSSLSHF